MLQASLSKFVNRESQDELYHHWRAVFSSETKQTCEVRMKGADAKDHVVRLESIAFGPESDRRCRTALIDLTAERQTQQQLQQSEQRYRRLTDELDDQGQLIAYDGLLRDITKRKVAEETLRLLNIDLGKSLASRTGELQQNVKELKLLTEAVSHLGEGVLITSDELDWPGPHILFVNDAMCQITGYTAEELIG